MGFNLEKELGNLTSKITGTVTAKAKDSAISTLKDPEFKATVNQFTKDWLEENKIIIGLVVGGFLLMSILAFVNIVTNLRLKR